MTANGVPAVDLETRRDYALLAAFSLLIATAAFAFYYTRGAILLYGDAPAHINIARRVFDSRTPGLFQLGTVWLPLPHLLEIPFIINHRLWQSGAGGSIPSLLAFVAGALGVFRLVRGMASRSAAWIAALIFTLNPNLIYLQSTAMTEPLYLALFIWTMVFFSEFVRDSPKPGSSAGKSLEKCGMVLAAAMLTRYDGWFLAAVLSSVVILYLWKTRRFTGPLRRSAIDFLLLTVLTACLWLAYNHAGYGNALEFANGPYSASAIQERSRTPTMRTYPGEHSARTAALYFLKLSRLNLGEGRSEYLLFTAAFVALIASIYFARRFSPWILLWAPLIFYTICIAWGSVPVYLPEWWPFSYYNLRYGLEMLPAVAVFLALGYELLGSLLRRRWLAIAAAVVIAFSYGSIWLHSPVCFREAHANGEARLRFEARVAQLLAQLPAGPTIMMDCSAHSAAVELAGIPFRRVLRESNPPYWEIALTQPARSASYVVAFENDDVWRAVKLFPQNLRSISLLVTRQGYTAAIYESIHK